MIQRIQTVWLLLGMACGVLLLYFPVWQADSGEGMDAIGAGKHFFLVGFPPVIFIAHALAIFTFKNRKRQIRFTNVNILLFVLFMIAALVLLEVDGNAFTDFRAANFRAGLILPVIGIIFNQLAKRSIRKDEELVRSMDRLR